MMMTDSNLDTHNAAFTAPAASGPTLLTDDEIAAVGGAYLDRELPYIEAGAGLGIGIGSGVLAGAVLTGVVLAGAPVLGTLAVVGCVAAAGVGMYMWIDGLKGTVSN